jgi:hypothetical protein
MQSARRDEVRRRRDEDIGALHAANRNIGGLGAACEKKLQEDPKDWQMI